MSTDRPHAGLVLTLLLVVSACAGGETTESTVSTTATTAAATTTEPASVVGTEAPASSTTVTTLDLPEPARVDDVLAECPSLFDVDFVSGRVDLVFDADPTAPILVCEESDGSADLTRLHERAIQALLVMEATTFEEPLPWTDLDLFDWFVATVDGIRFRDDIDLSFCCIPEGYINVQTGNLSALGTERWIDPATGAGLIHLIALFVHEARHAEGPVHTCEGGKDQTVAEMGAWAVQAFLFRWYADHADQVFFDDPDRPGYYADSARSNAERILETRICGESGG